MSSYSETVEDIRKRVYGLASDAGCMAPDNWGSRAGGEGDSSPGARLLLSVRDDFLHALEDALGEAEFGPDGDALSELDTFEDRIVELADSAPSVYTYERWQQFTDLGAWQQDISDYYCEITDLTNAAGIALYEIAKTLLYTLLTEVREAIEADLEEKGESEDAV